MEGFLPPVWCLIWYLVALPFVLYGVYQIRHMIQENREYLPLLGIAGAFIFILSALKMPSVTGSCSHPTGTGFSAICFGPAVTAVLGAIVLLFQALLLAHGGLSTLGANIVSMGIAGPLVGYGLYRVLKETRLHILIMVFLVAFISDMVTYIITSLELALAYPAETGGFLTSFVSFLSIFAITQVPLAIVEGCIIALVFKYVILLKPGILESLQVFSRAQMEVLR